MINFRTRMRPVEGQDCTWTVSPFWLRLVVQIACGRAVRPGGFMCAEHQQRMDGGKFVPGRGFLPAPTKEASR